MKIDVLDKLKRGRKDKDALFRLENDQEEVKMERQQNGKKEE